MNDFVYQALMNLVMVSDPTPLTLEEDAAVIAFMNEEARKRGFYANDGHSGSWVVAYHLLIPTERPWFLVDEKDPFSLGRYTTENEALQSSIYKQRACRLVWKGRSKV